MRLQREDGAIALEFALILPIFLLIVAGIVEFTVMLYDQQVLTNASREGARAGIIQLDPKPSDATLKASITSVVNTYLTGAGLKTASATITPTVEGQAFSDDITVRVDYTYNFLFLPSFTGGSASMTLSAITTMRHE